MAKGELSGITLKNHPITYSIQIVSWSTSKRAEYKFTKKIKKGGAQDAMEELASVPSFPC